MTVEEVIKEYDLTKKQVLNTLRYAAKLIEEENLAFV